LVRVILFVATSISVMCGELLLNTCTNSGRAAVGEADATVGPAALVGAAVAGLEVAFPPVEHAATSDANAGGAPNNHARRCVLPPLLIALSLSSVPF